MSVCVNCGAQLDEDTVFCANCGAKVDASPAPQPVQQNYYPPAYTPVPQVSTGGFVAWGIITLLLCTIPGIVALCKVGQINKATTVADQEKAISSTKTWCIIGTILGVLSLIGALAANG